MKYLLALFQIRSNPCIRISLLPTFTSLKWTDQPTEMIKKMKITWTFSHTKYEKHANINGSLVKLYLLRIKFMSPYFSLWNDVQLFYVCKKHQAVHFFFFFFYLT